MTCVHILTTFKISRRPEVIKMIVFPFLSLIEFLNGNGALTLFLYGLISHVSLKKNEIYHISTRNWGFLVLSGFRCFLFAPE